MTPTEFLTVCGRNALQSTHDRLEIVLGVLCDHLDDAVTIRTCIDLIQLISNDCRDESTAIESLRLHAAQAKPPRQHGVAPEQSFEFKEAA